MIMSDPRWSDETLDAFRMVGDPPADHAVEEVFATGSVAEVNRLMRTLVRNDMPPPGELPATLYHYFENTDDLPEWADMDAIARSQEFFMRNGLLGILIFSSYSLPICYAAARGVKVIYETARLYSDPHRRVLETSQMLLDVMAPGGLERSGSGVRTVQKVRLMHAAVRTLLLQRGWDSASLGVPINQEDLVGTLNSFDFCYIDGLTKLNVPVSTRQADDYVHTWNVVGHMMGVQRPLHPRDMDEATHLSERINQRHFAHSLEGQAMQEALTAYLRGIIPGKVFDGFPVALTRLFIGEERANIIGLPGSDWTQVALRPLRLVNGMLIGDVDQEAPLLARAASHFGQKMLDNLLASERGGERIEFHIPKTLRKAWKVK